MLEKKKKKKYARERRSICTNIIARYMYLSIILVLQGLLLHTYYVQVLDGVKYKQSLSNQNIEKKKKSNHVSNAA